MYHEQGPWDIVTNFTVKQYPNTFLPIQFPNQDIFVSETDNHLSTNGNKIFYDMYIKNDKNIVSALSTLSI